jgi:hypothetical protein
MGRFDAGDRHSDDLIAAIGAATHAITHTLREGFKLVALQIAASAPSQSADHTKAIEAQVQKLNALTAQLNQSVPKP